MALYCTSKKLHANYNSMIMKSIKKTLVQIIVNSYDALPITNQVRA